MARVKNGQKNVTKSVIPVCGQTQCPARTNGKADGLPVHPCATMRVQIPLLARELAVQAVRACGLLAQTGDLVLLVGLEIALEPVPVGRGARRRPPTPGCAWRCGRGTSGHGMIDHGAARELDAARSRATPSVSTSRSLVGSSSSSRLPPCFKRERKVQAVALAAGEHAGELLLVGSLEAEAGHIGAGGHLDARPPR